MLAVAPEGGTGERRASVPGLEMGLERYWQEPTIIEGDNLQANRWAPSDLITTGNKFIERDYFKVKEWIEAGY